MQAESKIMIKRNLKKEVDLNIAGNVTTQHTSHGERQESFLKNAIIKDEERRKIQMEDVYKRKDAHEFHGTTTNDYGNNFIDNDREARTLKFRRFVEQASELEDDIKGESQNEDDERDEDESEEDDSDDEKDGTDNNGIKKRKTFRVKPDPKYNGKKYIKHKKIIDHNVTDLVLNYS